MNNTSKLLKIIPSNWEIKRIKNIGTVNGGLTYSPDDVVDFDSDGAILVLRSSNIQEGKISYLDNVYVNVKVNKKQMTKIGDILICSRNGSRRLLGKNILIDENSKNLAFGAFMTILRTKYNRFVRYYLASGVFNDLLNSSTSTINQLTTRDINNIEIPLPSIIEQEKIVKFLDSKCSKIDQEVSLLQKKSILLDEYKNALIYETVTKGLDKNAVMKDSGVEWIGEVPKHWKIKRVCDSFNGLKKITQPGRTDVLSLTLNGVIEKDIENLKGLNPESYDTYQIFKKDNLVFKLIDLENYKTSRVGRVFKDGIMSSAYIRLEGKKNTNIDYNYYQFFDLYNRGIFNSIGSNGVRSTLNRSDLLKISLVVPPQKEQIEISTFLDTEIFKITKQIELINKKVELLKEYKQSLIYEAVTGQLEIE